jgi:DNA end-binding protein Ku
MAQTLWIGNIEFENINIPVKLHTSVKQDKIQFHLLHKTDKVKLNQQMICAYEKKPVLSQDQVRGYQVSERKYVLLDPEEIVKAEPEKSRSITVHEFVKTGDIDPIFMERNYYLEPKTPNKVYNALCATLLEMGCQGIATWTMRKRAYLGALRSNGKALQLTVLRFADEIIPAKSLALKSFSLSEKERKIAGELINKLTVRFAPEKFKNDHQKKLRALIEKKARGQKITLAKPRHLKSTQETQLLKMLEKSLEKVAV